MGEAVQHIPKAFTVNFSQIDRWDPNSYHGISWHWPVSAMQTIGSTIIPRKEKVDRQKYEFSALMPVTIHFDGSLEPRKLSDDKEYCMELFWARPGDIVVSKIDLKNGAVTIIPNGWDNVVVTNHFAVYQPDTNKINPYYLLLLVQAGFFKDHLWRNKVGAEGRKEVKLSFFEAQKVPIPSLSIQENIVSHWDSAQRELSSAETALGQLINALNRWLIEQTNGLTVATRSKFFLASYANLQQWDVKSGRASLFISENRTFLRLGDYIEECVKTIKPWDEPDKEWPIYGVNNKEGVFLGSMQKGSVFNAPYKKIYEDCFIHNPTRANVGSLGIVPQVLEDAITSPEYQVWRLTGAYVPHFLAILLKTEYFLSLVDFNRVGGVKQRMYYGNLAEIRLPEVAVHMQEDIVAQYSIINKNIVIANKKLALQKEMIEHMILGIYPVENT